VQAAQAGNVERDALRREQYAAMGWRLLEVWECELRDRRALCRRLAEFLRVRDEACG
jgi:DNA mismatch endonuclease (patch repair protein)